MKYDDASWHYGGDFPADLPSEAGATHIAMFVIWCWQNDLSGALIREEFPEALEKLKARSQSPVEIFIEATDEKFTDEDLNAEGNAFATAYYGDKGYYADLEAFSAEFPSIYYLPASWATFDKLAVQIKRRYQQWKRPQRLWFERLWPF